jgi:intracellular multiplication protein IcmG
MDNDPVNKSSEEEYTFSDADHSAEFSPPVGPKMSSPVRGDAPMGGRKTIFIVVGVVVAAFCLYKLYDVFSAAPVKPKNEMPVVTTHAPVVAVVSKPVESTPTVAVPEEISSVQNKVGSLEKIVSQVSQSNANLQDQMAGVSTAIADIQNNISSLSQQISDLSKPKEKPAEVKKTEENKVTKKKTRVISLSKSRMKRAAAANYYVKAMIQGRAWLITPEGATLTVSEGDNLPGYGVINSIDPVNSEVKTSSGAVIRHSSGDR